jgi:hypothetical protein
MLVGCTTYVETAMHCVEKDSDEWKIEFGAISAVISLQISLRRTKRG